MKTLAEKALDACREYDRLTAEIAKNRNDIGDGLSICNRIVTSEDGTTYVPDGKGTHLAEAFEAYDGGSDFKVTCYNTPEEIAEIIGECEGCKKAYEAIQARKLNRKKLGAIKRTIRAIGRHKEGGAV